MALAMGSKPYLLVSAVHSVTNWPFQYLPPWRGCHDCQNDELCQASKSTCQISTGLRFACFFVSWYWDWHVFFRFFPSTIMTHGAYQDSPAVGGQKPPGCHLCHPGGLDLDDAPPVPSNAPGGGRLKKRCFFFSTDFMKWLEIFGGVEKEAETQVWKTTICCLGLPTRSWIGDAWCWIDPGYCLGTGTTGFGAERFGLDVSWWDDFLSKVRMGLYIHIGITY